MKDTQELRNILLANLRPGRSVGIMSHVEPDGDGFAASLALQLLLRAWGLQSDIVTDPGSDLDRFSFLLEDAVVRTFAPGLRYDLLIVLDCNSYSRINARREVVLNSGQIILIDHHVPENGIIKTDFSFVDTAAVSAGAIIYRALSQEIAALPDQIRIAVASCIYVTIINDSNNFINSNTNSEVFRIAAELTDLGISPARLYKQYFLNHAAMEMRYIGEVLSTIELHNNDRILFMHSTLEMQRRNQLTADSIMNITRWVQGVKDIDVVAYLREDKPGEYKLSLRSPFIDVNAVAATYSGGGHRSASGANLHGDLPSLKAELLDKLGRALEQQPTHA
ncbi:MAG: DHH family phosphoesterase [Candidatus Cloacimonetes bacterium]|nr:DHH family phosphoesterase [Candidatus Cloacimonadota bacterium]